MSNRIKMNEIFTIPNLLSMFRILLLPVIVWFYNYKHEYIAAIIVLLISGLSDILDGIIARKFNMISDFGKVLDPIADKMTQGVLLICLIFKHAQVLILLGIFIVKEMLMMLLGYITIRKKNIVNGAKWYGKLNTVVIYSVIFLLIILPGIDKDIVNIMILVSSVFIISSFVMYARDYKKILCFEKKTKGKLNV